MIGLRRCESPPDYFLILAVAAAIYMCIGIYFGLTGKMNIFNTNFGVWHFGKCGASTLVS